MQSLIAIVVVFIVIYAIIKIKNCNYNVCSLLRICVKRLALYVMSFSWIAVVGSILMLACYSNISSLLKEVLSVNSVENIKSVVRLIFGVDSAFIALQMLALYSLMASFVACLAFTVGLAVRFVYRTFFNVTRATIVNDEQHCDDFSQHTTLTFKLFLKYNS